MKILFWLYRSRMNKNGQAPVKMRISIYQAADGQTTIDVKLENETVWLSQTQIVDLFQSRKANVSEHIKHIFQYSELGMEATVRNFRTVLLWVRKV